MYHAKHSFFCPDLTTGVLSSEESNHAVRVLRMKSGDLIRLVDGKGTEAYAEITLANKQSVSFKILKKNNTTSLDCTIHIALAPTKNIDRYQFFIEKVMEIGVTEITPILSSNSERKQLNLEKIRKNLVGAMKQSGNLHLPELHPLINLHDFLTNYTSDNQRFIAHCEEDSDKEELKTLITQEKNVVILIGPEGDFTSEEINFAKQKGFRSVRLGSSRLRTETAGIVACHTVHLI